MTPASRLIRHLLPRSLFGRAFLILMLPMVIVLATTTHMFYSRHWESVQRNMAATLAGEVAMLVEDVRAAKAADRDEVAEKAKRYLNLSLSFQPNRKLSRLAELTDDPLQEVFQSELRHRLEYGFSIQPYRELEAFRIRVGLPEGVLTVVIPRKRLENPTTYIFILWVTGASVVLSLIAVFFLRNQIRPILRLAVAAERFGKGQEAPQFKPQGAAEVRRAARAFLIMRDRITRQITARTEMLAGISHDLRTPLTRMKLELELLHDTEATQSLRTDVQAMERMIEEYLQFARGEGREETVTLDLTAYLEDLAAQYTRQGHSLEVDIPAGLALMARMHALRRCLQNLVDNALRYGSHVRLTAGQDEDTVVIAIDDDGPGIPPAQREEAFQAFHRLDPSRNTKTGGVGLGLTIARDIVLGHGGEILLGDSRLGGLAVIVRLPR